MKYFCSLIRAALGCRLQQVDLVLCSSFEDTKNMLQNNEIVINVQSTRQLKITSKIILHQQSKNTQICLLYIVSSNCKKQ